MYRERKESRMKKGYVKGEKVYLRKGYAKEERKMLMN